MYGIFSFWASAAMASAIFIACVSLSITQGPAMRKRLSPPMVTELFGMLKDFKTDSLYHRAQRTKRRKSKMNQKLGFYSDGTMFVPQTNLIAFSVYSVLSLVRELYFLARRY